MDEIESVEPRSQQPLTLRPKKPDAMRLHEITECHKILTNLDVEPLPLPQRLQHYIEHYVSFTHEDAMAYVNAYNYVLGQWNQAPPRKRKAAMLRVLREIETGVKKESRQRPIWLVAWENVRRKSPKMKITVEVETWKAPQKE